MEPIFYFLRKFHGYAGRILYINLLGMMLIGLLEGVGILLLIPIISVTEIVSIDMEGTPLSGLLQDLQSIPYAMSLPAILCLYVLLTVGQSFIQRRIAIQNTVIQHGFSRYLRLETYSGILHSNWAFFLNKRKSDLIHVLTAELARVSAGVNTFLQLMSSLVLTLIQISLALWLSTQITLFVLLSGAVLLVFSRSFLYRSLQLGKRTKELGESYLSGITDQIQGIKDIKSNTLEDSRMGWYRGITERMMQEQVEYSKLNTKSQLYYKISSSILIALFIFISVKMFNAQAAQLMLIIVIFSRLWPRVTGIQAAMQQIIATIPSLKAVIELHKDCKDAREVSEYNYTNVRPLSINKEIQCSQVHFRYDQKENLYALRDVNIVIPSNQMTAVVGPSGAGKSTLIDLLMGLNQPEKGQIVVDGVPLTSENLLSYRKIISYVPQDPFLFNTTIRENLELVLPGVTEKEMWEALEFSSAAEFVKKLPQGLDTLIGDRGVRLSGGECQRLVLARAILRKPSILILDEATSALDSENESKIQEAIDRLKGRMTIIVIAHRLSTIRNADQVVVLEQGRVIQSGGFHQLAKDKRGLFSHLLAKQTQVIQAKVVE